MMRHAIPVLFAGLAALALASCGNEDATRTFGTSRTGQDEIQARSLPPLSVPPALAQRPPRAGARTPDDSAAYPPDQAGSVTSGEGALVDAAGPSAPANIRERVDRDAQIEHQNPGFTDNVLFGQPGAGQSAAGEPIIQHGGKSWLDSIF